MANPEAIINPTTPDFKFANDVIVPTNAGKVIIVIFLMFIIIYVVIYVFKLYSSTSLITTTLLKKPISIPYTSTNITKDTTLPKNINGNQYSISTWVYVDEISQTGADKFILGRGTEHAFIPRIYLDRNNNLNVNVGDTSSGPLVSKNFPTNRWVNVVIVVDETLAQLYIDGQFKEAKVASGIFKSSLGNIYIGKATNYERLEGYLSKLQLFNYALTIDHTQIIYKAGPLHKSILSMIGIPMYGLRNPFVRMDEVKVE
jgi:hypothetical protein